MATLAFAGKTLWYESYGTGEPLILLNGIMMSTKSWASFIEVFSASHRLILFDFLDQGQSTRLNGISYDHQIQVEALHHLIVSLSLSDVHLFGISYGGEIALQYALAHPDRLKTLMLFNTAAWTSPWLREIGHAWNLSSDNPENYYATTIPVIYSPQFYQRKAEWMAQRRITLLKVFSDRTFMDAMVRLTDSSEAYDVRHRIHEIKVPTLVVSSEYDCVTPKNEQEFLASGIFGADYVMIPRSGHASMYECPRLFAALVIGYCSGRTLDFVV